ncbi:MAG: DUF4037 domain-containing protein [Chloroflexota bacterium]
MPRDISGLDLSDAFYTQVVKPIIDQHDPDLHYAAARIGAGSEVLGFDDAMSRDHDWGPFITIFLDEEEAHLADALQDTLRYALPHQFMGYSTNFITAPEDPSVSVMAITTHGTVNHRVTSTTVEAYVSAYLGWDSKTELTPADWLSFPSHKLRSVISGRVFHDGIGHLTHTRATLGWYPEDVWRYLLAAQWRRLGEEDHLMMRACYRGDGIGATLIASRLVNDIMRLCFLMEEQYAPYPKWFGTAFAQLDIATDLTMPLRALQLADGFDARQSAYSTLVEIMRDKHNQLNLTRTVNPAAQCFHSRPFYVSDGGTIATLLLQSIDTDHAIFSLPDMLGNIDQVSDHTGLRSNAIWHEKIKQLYH